MSYLGIATNTSTDPTQGLLSVQATYSSASASLAPLTVSQPSTFAVQSLTTGTDTYTYPYTNPVWIITTTIANDIVQGQTITLSGFVPTAYNGTYVVAQTLNSNVIYINNATTPGTVTTIGEIATNNYPVCANLVIDNSANGSYPTAFFDDNQSKFTYTWYEQPNNLLTTVATWVEDPYEVYDSTSMITLNYDGIGGKNATSPTLVSTTEII